MAGIDLVNFPNSKMGAAIAAGTSRFRVYGTDTTRFPNSKMGNAVTLGVSRFRSLQITGPPVIPANLTPPVISGTTQVNNTLTTTRGTWSGTSATYTYQWKSGVTNVGTNSASYTLVTADLGANITVVVTATNTAGSANATSAAVGPVTQIPTNTVLPAISGTALQGSVLSATTGTWTGTPTITYVYQWKRGGTNVGTNANTYTLVAGDVGANMTCAVTATNGVGNALATSNSLGPVLTNAPVNTVLPSITGTPVVGNTLTAVNGTWTGAATITFTYQWQRNGTNILTATTSTYLVPGGDTGNMLSVIVTGTNGFGNSSASSAQIGPVTAVAPVNTAPPVITGLLTVGSVMTEASDTWTGAPTPTISYQWLSSGVNVGSNATTYTTVTGDIGDNISCRVTATNVGGSANVTSNILGPITAGAGAPAAPDVFLNPISDTGTSGDNITNDNTPTLDFALGVTWAAGDVLEVRDNGGSSIINYTITSTDITNGSISPTITGPLSDGAHALQARHTNTGGASAWGTALNIVVDTTAPIILTSTTSSNLETTNLAIVLSANESVTWLINGGLDQLKFEISGVTLRWTSNGVHNFEAPNDSNADNIYVVQVSATDVAGNVALQTISVTVTNVNEAPVVAVAIPDQSAVTSASFSFQFAIGTFTDPDAGDTLTYLATKGDGTALPGWLTFNASTRTFSGTPSSGDVGTLNVKVTATDTGALSVSTLFNIVVGVGSTERDTIFAGDMGASVYIDQGTRQTVFGGGTYVNEG